MRKTAVVLFGLVLLGGATQAPAQETKVTSARPGYIGVDIGMHELLWVGPIEQNRQAQVIVRNVSKNSPAEKAGLKTGDEIMRINGMSVANGKFSAVARTLTEGDTVKLRIKRDSKEREVTLVAAPRPAGTYAAVLGDRHFMFSADSVRGLMKMYFDSARVHMDSIDFPRVYIHGDSGIDIRIRKFGPLGSDTLIFRRDTTALREMRKRWEEAGPPDVFRHLEGELGPAMIFRSMDLGTRSIAGAEFTDLDPAMKTYFGTDRGLLTLRVVPETPAARAGLQPGDIVKKANGRELSRVANLRTLLFESAGTIKLEVLRKGETKTLEIKTRKGSDD
jgi:membrane-associated protease RseP (regulator of RpoE activity)